MEVWNKTNQWLTCTAIVKLIIGRYCLDITEGLESCDDIFQEKEKVDIPLFDTLNIFL